MKYNSYYYGYNSHRIYPTKPIVMDNLLYIKKQIIIWGYSLKPCSMDTHTNPYMLHLFLMLYI